MIGVEARFDEDESAIDILNEQLQSPIGKEKEKPKKSWKFWKK
jgi:hypothetical protein